jgi:hypothetical protein
MGLARPRSGRFWFLKDAFLTRLQGFCFLPAFPQLPGREALAILESNSVPTDCRDDHPLIGRGLRWTWQAAKKLKKRC